MSFAPTTNTSPKPVPPTGPYAQGRMASDLACTTIDVVAHLLSYIVNGDGPILSPGSRWTNIPTRARSKTSPQVFSGLGNHRANIASSSRPRFIIDALHERMAIVRFVSQNHLLPTRPLLCINAC